MKVYLTYPTHPLQVSVAWIEGDLSGTSPQGPAWPAHEFIRGSLYICIHTTNLDFWSCRKHVFRVQFSVLFPTAATPRPCRAHRKGALPGALGYRPSGLQQLDLQTYVALWVFFSLLLLFNPPLRRYSLNQQKALWRNKTHKAKKSNTNPNFWVWNSYSLESEARERVTQHALCSRLWRLKKSRWTLYLKKGTNSVVNQRGVKHTIEYSRYRGAAVRVHKKPRTWVSILLLLFFFVLHLIPQKS